MVLSGRIDESNLLWTKVKVGGLSDTMEIEAMIDTGFSGELMIPVQVAVQLGLTLTATGIAELADGSRINQLLFLGNIKWGTIDRPVTISITESDVTLIGGGLLHGYRLTADFFHRLLFILEPEIDEPNVN